MKLGGNGNQLIATTSIPTKCVHCAVRARALFQGIPPDQLEWTQQYRENQYRAPARARLFSEGQQHPYVYTLYSGWVLLSNSLSDGRTQILRFALPGDFLGFQANATSPMSSSAYAITESMLCAFPKADLQRMMTESSGLAARMATLAARDMAQLQQVLLSTGQKNAREKLASLLLELYVRVRALGNLVPGSDEHSIVFPLSQEMLSQSLGLSVETVNRTLRGLREDQILEIRSKRLYMLDQNKAMAIAEIDINSIAEQALL
ncbi:MAG: Crp/Fnr family transcriptional regulator [Pseudomonadales bacterium]|nr:Crp/Fnr family transcriptional regulator [Pseudomonadales bacterium]